MRRRHAFGWLLSLVTPVLVLAALLFFAWSLGRLEGDRTAETRARLESAIRQSCVACYAAEGRYPQNLEVLKTRYGLQVDEARFAVFYEPVGANLMPNIIVLERRT